MTWRDALHAPLCQLDCRRRVDKEFFSKNMAAFRIKWSGYPGEILRK